MDDLIDEDGDEKSITSAGEAKKGVLLNSRDTEVDDFLDEVFDEFPRKLSDRRTQLRAEYLVIRWRRERLLVSAWMEVLASAKSLKRLRRAIRRVDRLLPPGSVPRLVWAGAKRRWDRGTTTQAEWWVRWLRTAHRGDPMDTLFDSTRPPATTQIELLRALWPQVEQDPPVDRDRLRRIGEIMFAERRAG